MPCLFSILATIAFGKTQQQGINHVNFPSPTAYSVARFAETPVNLYTGIPEIKIPLYEIKTKDLGLGMDLSYHAGGVKVNDVPGWVGSGWALNAGGVITRSVSGLNDDEPSKGFYYTGHQLNNQWPEPTSNYLESHRVGLVDGMPDMFYYSFNGKSGKFYFDNNGNIRTLPYANIKIELTDVGTINKSFYSVIFGFSGFKKWKITDEDGIVYYFEELELSNSSTAVLGPNGGYGDVKSLVTGWYLTKIVSPNGNNEIHLEYDQTNFNTSVSFYEYHSKAIGYYTYTGGGMSAIGDLAENRSSTTTRNYRHNLKRIVFPNGSVEFFTSERNDLPHPNAQSSFGSYKLDSVQVRDKANTVKRRFILGYIDVPSQRLTLKNLTVDGEKAYTFDYYNMHLLPGYTSRNTDHWGYFNGATNFGLGLIPTFSYTSQTYEDITYHGINKNPHEDRMKYGVLNKITWPTGGTTQFFFEPNDYSFVNGQPLADHGWSSWTYIDSSTTPSITFNSLAQVELWYECSTDGIVYGNNIEPCLSVLTPWNFNHSGTFNLTSYVPQNTGNIEVVVKLRYRTLLPGSVTKKFGGGIRVSETRHKDFESPPIIKKYTYTQEGDNTLSSGASGTNFAYHVQFISGSPSDGFHAQGVKAYSQSAFPLATTHGQHVGYQRVVEFTEGLGKSIHQFTSFYDYPDEIGFQNNQHDMPLMSKKSNEHRRGKLKVKEVNEEGGNMLQRNFTSGFQILNSGQPTRVWESKDFITVTLNTSGGGGNQPMTITFRLVETSAYTIDSQSFLPTAQTTELYGNGATPFNTETTNSYNAFHQLKSQKIYSSDGKFRRVEYKYPKEYTSPSPPLAGMIARNMVGSPIESVTYIEGGAIEGTAMKWALNSGNVLLDEVFELNATSPHSSFEFSDNASTFYQSYSRLSKLGHDSQGNINRIEDLGGNIKGILWDHAIELPVAEIQNADPSSVSYTSFETTEKGGWSYTGNPVTSPSNSKTGERYYNLGTGNITKSGIGASTENRYLLTFWARRSSGTGNWTFMGKTENLSTQWKLVERVVTGNSVNINGSGVFVDELRLHPEGSEMATFTYDPIYGLTNKTDQRNSTVKFEYDHTGRLRTVWDEDGNILNHHEYNYVTGQK